MGDWANHLSTLFPDVRLKRFLEMRGADGGPWRRICALPAFWVGLLYDDEALDAAETLTARLDLSRRCWRCATPCRRRASRAEFRDTQLARGRARGAGDLARRAQEPRPQEPRRLRRDASSCRTLDEVVARGTTSAEEMLSAYHTRWGGSIEPVFLEYAY